MTSWNRRVSAAAANTQRHTFSRTDLLKEALSLGVRPDDQAALLALAKVAAEREGFRVGIAVHGATGEIAFEVLGTSQGPIARVVGSENTDPASPAAGGPETRTGSVDAGSSVLDDEGGGIEIVSVLTDTLVETPDLVAVFASVGHEAIWANDAFVTLIPIRESDKVWLVELLDEWSKGHYEVKVLPALVKYGRWRGRLTLLTGDDTILPVSAVIVAHRDHRGEIESVSMVARDLSELKLAEERAAATETRFAALVEHVGDIIAVLDHDGIIRYASPAATRGLGHADGALNGTKLLDLVHPDDVPTSLLELAQPDEQGIGSPVELRLRASDDSWRHLEVIVSDLTDNPVINGLVLNARDVTERVESAHALAVKAYTDPLTGLPNRMRLLDRMAQALSDTESDGSVGVLLCDLDRFKVVNDSFGQDVADAFVSDLAHRLSDAAGPTSTVARVRSDEFVVLMRDLGGPAEAIRMANRLRSIASTPFRHERGVFEVTASVGIAFNEVAQQPEDLLRNADQALLHAKDNGRDRTEVFSPELAARVNHRRTIEKQLRHMLDQESLTVHYQPIVDVETEHVVAAEALLRIHDSAGELLSPAEFIEAAESSGLITRLGSQVLQVTCEQLATWGVGPDGGTAREVSVNVSPRQLADPELPALVRFALDAAGVEPARLCLEITESILIGRQSSVDAGISYLRALGVKIGLDEFGAGQSSLGYLKRFPLDFVKIDKSLIAGLGTNEQDTAIVRATIELAHNLGLVVVAVGVENDTQLEALQLLECDRAQGYLFAPAGPPDQFDTVGPTP